MTLDDATKDNLKAKHGNLRKLTTVDGVDIVVRGPTMPEWRRYQEEKTQNNGAKEPVARETIVRSCLVFPAREQALAQFEKYPLLVDKLSNEIALLGMGTEDVRAEKL